MKYLFVVQGEGRGHFTQTLSMKAMLERNGHEVVAVMVGCSAKRKLPDFFLNKIDAELIRFQSPNFLPSPKGKRSSILISILYNLIFLPVYIQSILTIIRTIREKQPDVVVNFYELMWRIQCVSTSLFRGVLIYAACFYADIIASDAILPINKRQRVDYSPLLGSWLPPSFASPSVLSSSSTSSNDSVSDSLYCDQQYVCTPPSSFIPPMYAYD